MKRLMISSLLTIFTILFSTVTNAQKGFYIGAQGAPQLSVMFNKDDVSDEGTNYKAKFSHTFGANAGYNFNERMGIGTEAMYSTVNQRYEATNASYTQRLSYLKVPLLFTYNSNPAARVVFTAKAGPQVSLLMKAAVKDADQAAMNGDNKDKYRDIVYGLTAGAGARVKLAGNLHLTGGLRFDGSIGNIEDNNYKGYNNGRAKTYDLNAGIEVGLKYFLN